MRRGNTIFIAAYARLPKDIPAYALYNSVGVYAEVDVDTGVIVDADVSFYSQVSINMVKSILKGANIVYERGRIVEELEMRYWGGARKALITAVKRLFERFDEVMSLLEREATPDLTDDYRI